MHRQRIDHHEYHPNQRRENQVDRQRDEPLDVLSHLLKLAEGLAAALILEDGVRQLQRVANAVRVHLGAHSLHDDVDVVVLKILGDS